MRTFIAGLLLLVLPLVAACSNKAPDPPAAPVFKEGLVWTGTEITGLTYYTRETERALVHYALPTLPGTAEAVAQSAAAYYANQAKQQRLPLAGQVDIWIVPPTHAWPQGAPETLRGMYAVAPGVIIVHDFNLAGGGQGMFNNDPLHPVLAAATFEPAGSPIYAQEWLQVGMGAIRTEAWNFFPQQFWRMGRQGSSSGNLLADATDRGANAWVAWIMLSSAIFDRFGMGWSEAYMGDPATLTPEAALKWAMGADTPEQALSRWTNRLRLGQGMTGSRPDLNPERMAPKLAQLPPGPGPNPNYSPQTYRINAELDAAKGTVSGEMRLTWQNGEGIPLDALYFNVWANAERHRMYGGFSEIESVTVDGKPATFMAKGIDLKVELGRTVQPGETAEVTVRFATHLTGNQTYGLALTDGKRFTLSQFYPILGVLDDRGWNLHALSYAGGDPYAERADYQVSLTVPAGFLVGGAGRQTARVENGKTWTYSYDAPGVPEWSAVGGLEWMETKVTVDGTSVRMLGPLPAWHEQVKAATDESLRFLKDQLGAFPYPELVVVHGNLKLPGIASAGDVDAQGVYKNGLANSLASQWFGAYVGNDQWTEAWLDEGLAKYMEHEAARALGRGQLTFGVRLSDRPRDGRVTQNGMTFLLTRNYDLMADEYGALFFEALEERIGSAAMNGLLRQWIREYGGKTATGADLVRLAEATAGPLGPLREQYGIEPNDRQPYKPVLVPGYDE